MNDAESAGGHVAMKILILGGTAFLGPQIVETALARKHEVTLFNRGKTRKELFPEVEKLRGDRDKDDYAALKGRKWDAVIDTPAQTPHWIRQAAAALGENVRQYVFISSISVYPMNSFQKPGKDETAPVEEMPPGTDDTKFQMELYGAFKAASERAVMQAYPKGGTVIRPGLIVGPGDYSDRFSYWPVRVDKGGEILAPGSPESPVQFIDARDLGAWIVKVVEDGHTGTYNATGPQRPLPMAGLLYGCKAAVSNDSHFTWVPDAFCLEHGVGPWMEMPLWIPDEPDSRGFSQVSVAKAIQHGLTFRPLADTATATLDWYKNQRPNRKPRAGMTAEKEAAVLKAWHEKQGSTTAPTTEPATAPSR
jgi:2'-hydroxyisoflavone reductase